MMVAGQPNTISNVCLVLKYIQYVCIFYKILLSNTDKEVLYDGGRKKVEKVE